ncbi:hypothetical protein FAM09_13905 [Niastella caeni]|uniref:Uncharacterized protein n=1 Tax=Niastella caeni TaxID=2569763 RepID=A0A4S8HWI2_9BACT|nr:hypothetical protein [Niastella caeni]THU39591.1 hypothetical protein FAM09_13905 [Niastella caeni]
MPTTVKLKHAKSQEINLFNSPGFTISNVSSAAITYYVDYLPANSDKYSAIQNGTLTNATPQNTVAFTSSKLPASKIRVTVEAKTDDGTDIASVVY